MAGHRWHFSSEGSVLPGRSDTVIGSANSLHALTCSSHSNMTAPFADMLLNKYTTKLNFKNIL